MGQVVIRDARVSDAAIGYMGIGPSRDSDGHKAIKYYESQGWAPTGKTQIDKLDDLELHEIQYGTAI